MSENIALPCVWKQSFHTPGAAVANGVCDRRKGVNPYKCAHCGKYHLTSKETLPIRKLKQMDKRK